MQAKKILIAKKKNNPSERFLPAGCLLAKKKYQNKTKIKIKQNKKTHTEIETKSK